MTPQLPHLSYARLVRLAIPIILANAAVPLLGLVDTAVIGHSGSASDLGAIALGSLVFSFVYWGFGFLRMGTTGFVAQALGAGQPQEAQMAFARALLMGLVIGTILIALQVPTIHLALWLLDASSEVNAGVVDYWYIRIWAAPATLATYAIMGTLIGLGKTRALLWLQLYLNGVNLLLDILFVVGFGWGVKGIALGTLIAEYSCALLGLWWVVRLLLPQQVLQLSWPQLLQAAALRKTLATNANIMWRTLLLLAGFGLFSHLGASFGDSTLAANHILLQFIAFAAFFLDGFAFVVETLVGRAIGARRRDYFSQSVRLSSQVAALCALLLALLLWQGGSGLIALLTPLQAVREAANAQLHWAALYVLCAFATFVLDGIFIGATASRAMRNAAFFSLLLLIDQKYIS